MAAEQEFLFWRVGHKVVYETTRKRAKRIYGLTREPDLILTLEEYQAANYLVRIVNDEIFLGYTPEEVTAMEKHKDMTEITELKQKLKDTDYVAVKIAEGEATKEEYADILEQRKQWRERINELEEKWKDSENGE